MHCSFDKEKELIFPASDTRTQGLYPGGLLLLSAVVAALLASCSASPQRPRNLILISVDTLRADALGCYGNREAKTPHIDDLARKGILFENCFSHIPITLPSHASLFCSRMPHELKVFNNAERLSSRAPCLPQLLKQRQFNTAAFVSLGVLFKKFGLARGFDTYGDDFKAFGMRWYKWAHEVNYEALSWLEANRQEPFFLWLHYSDPHEPYYPHDAPPDLRVRLDGEEVATVRIGTKEKFVLMFTPEPQGNRIAFEPMDSPLLRPAAVNGPFADLYLDSFEIKKPKGAHIEWSGGLDFKRLQRGGRHPIPAEGAEVLIKAPPGAKMVRVHYRGGYRGPLSFYRSMYDREVRWVDQCIGKLLTGLDELNLAQDTAIVLTADHGEEFGEHGVLGHIHNLYDSSLRVPLIVRLPGDRGGGKRFDQNACLMDVAPTILGLLGAGELSRGMAGRDLLMPEPRAGGKDAVVLCETFRNEARADRAAVFDGTMRLIHTPPETFELYDVRHDPAQKHNLYVEEKGDRMVPLARKLLNDALLAKSGVDAPELSQDDIEALHALGYMGE